MSATYTKSEVDSGSAPQPANRAATSVREMRLVVMARQHTGATRHALPWSAIAAGAHPADPDAHLVPQSVRQLRRVML